MDTPNFKLVKKAGIPTAHFARICGCTRVSATLWLSGKVHPRGLYLERVVQQLQKIETAMTRGRLPLPDHIKRDNRFKALTRALRG